MDRLPTPVFLGFPWVSAGKESACNVGDLGSISGLGRSPGERKGYPLQYSGLENSMNCIVMGSQRVGLDWETFHFHFQQYGRPGWFSARYPGSLSLCHIMTEGRKSSIVLGQDHKYILMSIPNEGRLFLILFLIQMKRNVLTKSSY